MKLKHSCTTPIYAQVAYDIAAKIAAGDADFQEGRRLTGRSLMGSQYAVSSETIRRAMRLLADIGVVQIQQNSGAIVKSRHHAVEYLAQYQADKDLLALKAALWKLTAQRDQLNRQINELFQKIMDLEERFQHSDQLRTYEFPIKKDSPAAGKTIGQLQFRQNTGATIIAVRRKEQLQLSPGPQVQLEVGDVLMVACDVTDISRVTELVG
jgi:K+/H+ antiporter YhaU regulatory subunit KhtT